MVDGCCIGVGVVHVGLVAALCSVQESSGVSVPGGLQVVESLQQWHGLWVCVVLAEQQCGVVQCLSVVGVDGEDCVQGVQGLGVMVQPGVHCSKAQ